MTGIFLSDERRAFSHWLRTGRRLAISNPASVEVKFNPWHDPSNGQFTFANSGTHHGIRGGGGRFGGGGASGTWRSPKISTPIRKPLPVPKPQRPRATPPPRPVDPAEIRAIVTRGETHRRVMRNGYEYQIDSIGQMRRVSGTLTLGKQLRNRRAQAAAGGADRLPTDDGGHYIAARFNGPPEAFNHFAQDANFNRGTYRALEDQLARAKVAGKNVKIEIVPRFVVGSTRPDMIDVIFSIDGHHGSVKLPNGPQGKNRGR